MNEQDRGKCPSNHNRLDLDDQQKLIIKAKQKRRKINNNIIFINQQRLKICIRLTNNSSVTADSKMQQAQSSNTQWRS